MLWKWWEKRFLYLSGDFCNIYTENIQFICHYLHQWLISMKSWTILYLGKEYHLCCLKLIWRSCFITLNVLSELQYQVSQRKALPEQYIVRNITDLLSLFSSSSEKYSTDTCTVMKHCKFKATSEEPTPSGLVPNFKLIDFYFFLISNGSS